MQNSMVTQTPTPCPTNRCPTGFACTFSSPPPHPLPCPLLYIAPIHVHHWGPLRPIGRVSQPHQPSHQLGSLGLGWWCNPQAHRVVWPLAGRAPRFSNMYGSWVMGGGGGGGSPQKKASQDRPWAGQGFWASCPSSTQLRGFLAENLRI